jgi:curved DNA-binding protein CbpA
LIKDEHMSDVVKAIEKHLGNRLDAGQLTHYSLLGIESDATGEQIRAALKAIVAKYNASDIQGSPKSAQVVAGLIRQAQSILLDASKRASYDRSLQPASSSTDEDRWFPSEDAWAPFQPLVYANSSTATIRAPWESVQDRWTELCRRLPELSEQPIPISNSAPPRPVPATLSLEQKPAPKLGSVAERIERNKRKRRMQQRLYAAGFVIVAVVFLGYAAIQFMVSQSQVADAKPADSGKPSRVETSSEGDGAIGGKKRQSSGVKDSSTPVRSNLPSLSTEDSDSLLPDVAAIPSMTEEASPPRPDMVPNEKGPEMTDAASSPNMKEAVSEQPPATSSSSDLERKKEWIGSMKAARQALDSANYSKFREQITKARGLCEDDEQRAMWGRLDQLGQLCEIFSKAMDEAKTKLASGDVLTVGKQKLSVVESRADVLVVRSGGENKRFPWEKLPPGVAIALSDLMLSKDAATDVAARAAFFSVSQPQNELLAPKVTEWFEKSVGKGGVREDLPQALSDMYE